MNNNVKNVILLVLVIGLVSMTVAYAVLSQQLDITSTASVKGSSWDIHFENLSSVSTLGEAKVNKNPVLGVTTITGLDVLLTEASDQISYTFDVANKGTIDAIITDYKINTAGNGIVCTDSLGQTNSDNANAVCNNLKFTITYAQDTTADQTNTVIKSGTEILKGQQLNSGQSVKLKLTLSYSGLNPSTSDITIKGLDALIMYSQN